MSATVLTIVIIVAVLVIGLVAAGWYLWRHQSLRRRYGPEYDRLAEQDGRRAAERELRDRQRRHAQLELRELDPAAKERYRAAWTEVQTRFVDNPEGAIGAADELVTRLAADRGYPTGDYEEQVAQLSVEHARTLDHYRFAHDVYQRHQRGEATTEQLREALVHYRTLFADLLGEDPVNHTGDAAFRPNGDGHADGVTGDGRVHADGHPDQPAGADPHSERSDRHEPSVRGETRTGR